MQDSDTYECRTKSTIMDAAERLFASYGFEGTSLRTITAEAHANLGAVNYHFTSKGGLIQAVLKRMFQPVNQERLRLLGELEIKAKGKPLEIEAILDALFRPPVELVSRGGNGAWYFPRLLAFCLTEPGSYLKPLVEEEFALKTQRFLAALQRACPRLTKEEVRWRLQFSMGAYLHTVGNPQLLAVTTQEACTVDDPEEALRRIVGFCAAGFRTDITSV